jgi:hypothetical protein
MKASASGEHRSAYRRRVKQRARALLKPGAEIECTLLDTSETGARLSFRNPVILPKRFRMYLTEQGRDVDVSVIWQKGTLAGVRYAVRQPEPKAKSAGFVRRLFAVG